MDLLWMFKWALSWIFTSALVNYISRGISEKTGIPGELVLLLVAGSLIWMLTRNDGMFLSRLRRKWRNWR